MTQLLLTIIIGIGIAAVAAAGALSLFHSARDGVDQQLLWARMEQTAAAIRAKTLIVDGLPVLPMAETATDNYPAVPTWVTAAAFDNNGRRFVYCPFALRDTAVEGTGTTVTGPGYSVVTYSSTITGSKTYVIGAVRPAFAGGSTATAAPQGLLGVLISFKPKDTYTAASAVNWCNNLSVSAAGVITATYSSQSGVVYPLIAPQGPVQQALAKRDVVTLYASTAASGDGTGRNTSNYTTLNAAFAQLAALRPLRAKIYLNGTPHTLSSITKTDGGGTYVYNIGNLQQTIYDIEGAGSGSTTVTLSTNYDLPINTYWRNLTLAPAAAQTVTAPANTKMIIDGAILSNVIAKQGTVWVRGTSAINNSLTVTDMGRVVMNGTVTSSMPDQGIKIQPGRVDVLSGATWAITATSAASTPSAPVIVYGGGILSNSSSTSPAGISITSNGSTQLKSAMNVVPGGIVNMNSATMSLNSGSSTIAGDGGTRAGAIVMGGEMFMVGSGLLFPGGTSSNVAGVVLVDGGKFFMHNNSYIGNSASSSARPYIGVYDNGGSQVGGSTAGYSSGANGEGGGARSNIYAHSSGKCWDGNGDPYSTGLPTAQRRHLFIDSDEGDTQYSSPKDTYSSAVSANMLTYTNNLSAVDWTSNGTGTVSVAAKGVAANDSSRTAITLSISRANSTINAGWSYNVAKTMTGQYTATAYVKASGANIGKTINFWQNNGSVRNVTSIVLTGSWQRITMTNSYSFPGASVANPFIIGLLANGSGGSTETAVTFDVWGAQLQSGASATAYSAVGTTTLATTQDYRHLRMTNNSDWLCTGTAGGGGCGTPGAFSYTDLTGQQGSCLVESNTLSISGQSCAVAITISGGTTPAYSKNGGAWTSAPGTVSSGDTIRLRNTTSASHSTAVNTLVTIGSTSDTWTITTMGSPMSSCGGGGGSD